MSDVFSSGRVLEARPRPACAAVLPAGCEARGRSPRGPVPSGTTGEGKAGRVNASEPSMTPRHGQLREMGWKPG